MSFPCPHCATPLRVRDREFINRVVNCPECGAGVHIIREGAGELRGEPVDEQRQRSPAESESRRRTRVNWAVWLTPSVIAWGVAFAMTGLLAMLLITSRGELATTPQPPPDMPTDAVAAPVPGPDAPPQPVVVADPQPAVEQVLPAPVAPVTDEPKSPPPAVAPAKPEPDRTALPVARHDDATPNDVQLLVEELARSVDVPILVPLAEETRRIDVRAALTQRVAGFEQSVPVPFRDLLSVVEEMAGVPISTESLSPSDRARLESPVTLVQRETTVGALLQELVASHSLRYEIHGAGLRLLGAAPDEPHEGAASVGVGEASGAVISRPPSSE